MFILIFSNNVNTSANQMIAKYLTKDADVSQCVVDFPTLSHCVLLFQAQDCEVFPIFFWVQYSIHYYMAESTSYQ